MLSVKELAQAFVDWDTISGDEWYAKYRDKLPREAWGYDANLEYEALLLRQAGAWREEFRKALERENGIHKDTD